MTYDNTPSTLPNAWIRGLKHSATVTCVYCKGRGRVEFRAGEIVRVENCEECAGLGVIDLGCGGVAEFDINYGLAFCRAEDAFVPRNEVPLP